MSAMDAMDTPLASTTAVQVLAAREDLDQQRQDLLATEEPLEIRALGADAQPVSIAVTMRTPGHDLELAVGFLWAEGLLDSPDDLRDPPTTALHSLGPGNLLTLRLRRPFDADVLRRNFVATSSCGVCGKATLDQLERAAPPLPAGPIVPRRVLLGLPAALRQAQVVFTKTGGLHATGLFDSDGQLLVLREDVGRHNAFDKVVGRRVLDRAVPLHGLIGLVSGRLSFELVQKAAMAGLTLLCAVSAPSSLAVQTAERVGMTLCGFLRAGGFNVYTHPQRVDLR